MKAQIQGVMEDQALHVGEVGETQVCRWASLTLQVLDLFSCVEVLCRVEVRFVTPLYGRSLPVSFLSSESFINSYYF